MNHKNNIAVIIPAAGSGIRFGGNISKQFLKIGNETVIERTVNKFLENHLVNKIYIAVDHHEALIKSQSFFKKSYFKSVEIPIQIIECPI